MFEAFGKFVQSGNAIDAAIGVIAGSALGLVVASMASDLVMAAALFVVIQAFNKIGRKRRPLRSGLSSQRSLLLRSQSAECGPVRHRHLRQVPPMTG